MRLYLMFVTAVCVIFDKTEMAKEKEFLRLERAPLEKSENRLFLFFVFLLMKSERAFVLLRNKMGDLFLKGLGKRIFPSSEFRAEKIWSLMVDLRTIVPENVFLLIIWERVFYKDYGTKWSFIAERGTNCSEFRIPSGTNWTLMDDLRTIVPENVFLSITLEPSSESRAEQCGLYV